MQKESFIFYKSFYEAIKKIPEEYQLEIYNAISSYCFDGKKPENLSGVAEAMFILMKPNIDSAEKRYNASVENGKKGGRPRKNDSQEKPNNNLNKTQGKPNNNLNETQKEPNQNFNVDEDVDEDVDDNVDDNVEVDVEKKTDINSIINVYENNIAPITDITYQLLSEYCNILSPPLVLEAIYKANKANARTFRYVEGILKNWEKKGFKKICDVKNEEQEFKNRKQTKKESIEESVKRKIKELEESVNANK